MSIREEIELDITAALRRTAELEAAVGKATKTNLKLDTGTSGGLGLATKELGAYESAIGKAGVSTGQLLTINRNLASSFGSGVTKPAAEAEHAVGRFHEVVGEARAGISTFAQTAAGKLSPALGEAAKLGGEVGKSFSIASGAAVGIAGAAVVAGLAIAKMTLEGIGDFVSLADQVRTVQRVTGATAEESSRLNAVFRATGVSADTGAAAIFKLSRNVANHADVLEHDGIEIAKNAKGQTDLIDTLGSVGEAYQRAGKGAAGNRVLFDAFGRSGLALAPILALDREKLDEFVAAAEKHHEILTQDDLDKARAYKIAQHELTESFEGMERELGLAVIPALTSFLGQLTSAIEGVDSLGQQVAPLVDKAGGLSNILKIGGVNVGAFGSGLKLLGGDFRGAAEDAIPFGKQIGDLIFGNDDAAEAEKKHAEQVVALETAMASITATTGITDQRLRQLADTMGVDLETATTDEIKALEAAAEKLGAAVTPTQRLASVTEVLSNKYSTTKENVDAFGVALDAALGSFISAEEATIRVRQRMDDLTKAIHDGVQKGQTHQQYLDDITLKTDAVTQSIENEVKALVTSGDVEAGSAAQKDALVSRLLAVADTYDGPVAQALREHAYRVAQIPDEKSTKLDVDTKDGQTHTQSWIEHIRDVTKYVTAATKAGGEDAGHQWDAGLAGGIDGWIGIVRSAATRAANVPIEVTRAVHQTSSPSKVGIELGGFFVEGIALGMDQKAALVYDQAFAAAHGLTDVWRNASQVTAAESLKIWSALDKVRDAQTNLRYIEADEFATTEQLTRARQELAVAQEDVNSATFDALDSTHALTDALAEEERQAQATRDGFDSMVGAYNAVIGARSAQRSLDQAQREETAARARQAALPGETAAAEKALADARTAAAQVTASEALAIVRAREAVAAADAKVTEVQADGTASADQLAEVTLTAVVAREALAKAQADAVGPTQDVTDAQRKLSDLQLEASKINDRVRDATEAVTDAQFRLIGAEQQLADSGTALTGTHSELVAMLTALGTAAGLTRSQIDGLVASVESATNVAHNAGVNVNSTPGRLVNTSTGRPAFTGPRGEGGTGAPRGVPGETSWVMPDGTRVWYVPNHDIDPGNVGALSRTATPQTGTTAARAIEPNINAHAGTVAGSRDTFTPNSGVDPAVIAQIIAGLGGIRPLSVTVNPKTAVYDMKQTAATVRTMELLHQ